MANLMILGASILQLPLIKHAQKKGYNTIVVSPNKNEPGFNYATHRVYSDVRDEELILKKAKEYSIVGILTDQTDIPVRTAAYVAEHLGLPGIGYETACLFTDKYKMREKCRELGIPTLRYQLTKSLLDAIDFFDTLKKDVILKPVDNQGSKGVSRVRSKEELVQKFEEAMTYSKSKSILVEEFVTGQEFVVEGIAYNYNFQNLICGDTYYFKIPDVFSATKRVFPSTSNKSIVEKVKEVNRKIITGFGLRQGITHSEFILSGGEIYLIETAARGGGVFISSDIIPLCTGLNTEDFLIDIATCNLSQQPSINHTGIACCYIAFYLPVGEIVSIDGIETVKSLSFTHRHNLDNIKIGALTKPFKDKTARYFIIISADNHEQLDERIKIIRNTLNIEVKTTEGLKGPIWE